MHFTNEVTGLFECFCNSGLIACSVGSPTVVNVTGSCIFDDDDNDAL